MRHKTIKKKLLRYLDQELSEKEMLRVRDHLTNCPACRNDLTVIESLWLTGRPVKRMTAPPFLWTRISSRILPEEKPSIFNNVNHYISQIVRPAFMIIILPLIVAAGIGLGNWITPIPGYGATWTAEKTLDTFGLGYFGVMPPGSIDAQILVLTESEP